MPHFRIVKVETITNGKLTTEYAVQKLFLFWWVGVRMYCIYRSGPTLSTIRTFHLTEDLEFVRKYMQLHSTRHRKVKYKGCKLALGLTTAGDSVWFSNKKSKYSGGWHTFYLYAPFLVDLKALVDAERPTVSIKKIVIK